MKIKKKYFVNKIFKEMKKNDLFNYNIYIYILYNIIIFIFNSIYFIIIFIYIYFLYKLINFLYL